MRVYTLFSFESFIVLAFVLCLLSICLSFHSWSKYWIISLEKWSKRPNSYVQIAEKLSRVCRILFQAVSWFHIPIYFFLFLLIPLLWREGKITRPFRYDLNQILYNYPVEVGNRFKGLDLIDRVPDELWTEVHDIVQETGIKTIPKKKKYKKAKWLSEEALQISVKRREAKSKG